MGLDCSVSYKPWIQYGSSKPAALRRTTAWKVFGASNISTPACEEQEAEKDQARAHQTQKPLIHWNPLREVRHGPRNFVRCKAIASGPIAVIQRSLTPGFESWLSLSRPQCQVQLAEVHYVLAGNFSARGALACRGLAEAGGSEFQCVKFLHLRFGGRTGDGVLIRIERRVPAGGDFADNL